jgi:hypothetical protein
MFVLHTHKTPTYVSLKSSLILVLLREHDLSCTLGYFPSSRLIRSQYDIDLLPVFVDVLSIYILKID